MSDSKNGSLIENYLHFILGGVYVIGVVATFLIGILVLHLPVVPIGIFCLAEALLSGCLSQTPIWVHAAVFVVQLSFGIFFGQAPIMICMGVMYLLGVFFLHIWSNRS